MKAQMNKLERAIKMERIALDSRIECYKQSERESPHLLRFFWFRQLRDTLLSWDEKLLQVEKFFKEGEK